MLYKCKTCEKVVSLKGANGHLRFKHGIEHGIIKEKGLEYYYTLIEGEPEKKVLAQIPLQNEQSNFKAAPANDLVDQRRVELELLRMDKEIERLQTPAAPNTNLDYFSKMLELQQTHNTQVLAMQKSNFDVQIQLEKLKLGTGEDENNLLPLIIEHLPAIMKAKARETEQNIPKNEVIEVTKTKKELEQYKKDIIDGKISREQAYEDFKREYPKQSKMITEEFFNEKFKDIKEGKGLNISNV